MTERWSRDQVLALAPDASSQKAAQGVAAAGKWSLRGTTGTVLFGECKGSGAKPYLAAVDLSEPAYRCSCPSRKFPCKHALGLLLLWSADGVPVVGEALPQWVAEWLDGRADRAAKSAARLEAARAKAAGGAGVGGGAAGGADADPQAGIDVGAGGGSGARLNASDSPPTTDADGPQHGTESAPERATLVDGAEIGPEGATLMGGPGSNPESAMLVSGTGSGPDGGMPVDGGGAETGVSSGGAPSGAVQSVAAGSAPGRGESVRHQRVAAGLAELERWLADQVRQGLAGAQEHDWDGLAKRLIDAQAPGVAGVVSRLARVRAEENWPGRLLEEYALINLLAIAYRRRAHLPERLAQTVLIRTGFPVTREEVLAGPPVRDHWDVLGRRDEVQDRLTARRVWLRGRHTGRPALILSFAPQGQALDASLVTGTTIDADLTYYPGAAPLRALVATRHGTVSPTTRQGSPTTPPGSPTTWPGSPTTWPGSPTTWPGSPTTRPGSPTTRPGSPTTAAPPPSAGALSEAAPVAPAPPNARETGAQPQAPQAAPPHPPSGPPPHVASSDDTPSHAAPSRVAHPEPSAAVPPSATPAAAPPTTPPAATTRAQGIPPGMSPDEALDEVARALAEDPWTESWPLVLTDVTPDRTTISGLPLHPRAHDPWRLMAVSGGHPLTVAAEWTPQGLRPLTAWDEDGTAVIL
ncbi:SWIM zinc finger family protein [Nonomuraea monospora]|uniref:SWIM zinc finger family protein n=1 Tax=Nonomuraea monospora TaxID=568818 RepID=UPI0031D6D5FB